MEVGANIGGATLLLAKLSRFVHAFEPNPRVYAHLQSSVENTKNVKVYNLGAGSRSEMASFNLPSPKQSIFGSRFRVTGGRYLDQIEVRMVRLDEVKFRPEPTCLILDCEGSEVAALEGARALFESGAVKTVLVEMHYLADGSDTIAPTIDFLIRYGFDMDRVMAPDGSPWVSALR